MGNASDVWDRARSGRHTVVVGLSLPEPPHDMRVVRVSCDVPLTTLGPLLEARERVERILGTGAPLVEAARARVLTGLRRHLLGDLTSVASDGTLVDVFNRLAALGPAVLELDTAEAADPASLDMLRHILGRPGWLRLPLVITMRAEPSSASAVALVEAVRAASGDDAVLRAPPPPEPPSARRSPPPPSASSVDPRALPADVVRVLRALAIAGSGCEAAILASVLEVSEIAVLDALQRAADAGVRVEDRGEGRFHLPQATVDALRASILPSLAAALHRRVAEILARDRPAAVPAAVPTLELSPDEVARPASPWELLQAEPSPPTMRLAHVEEPPPRTVTLPEQPAAATPAPAAEAARETAESAPREAATPAAEAARETAESAPREAAAPVAEATRETAESAPREAAAPAAEPARETAEAAPREGLEAAEPAAPEAAPREASARAGEETLAAKEAREAAKEAQEAARDAREAHDRAAQEARTAREAQQAAERAADEALAAKEAQQAAERAAKEAREAHDRAIEEAIARAALQAEEHALREAEERAAEESQRRTAEEAARRAAREAESATRRAAARAAEAAAQRTAQEEAERAAESAAAHAAGEARRAHAARVEQEAAARRAAEEAAEQAVLGARRELAEQHRSAAYAKPFTGEVRSRTGARSAKWLSPLASEPDPAGRPPRAEAPERKPRAQRIEDDARAARHLAAAGDPEAAIERYFEAMQRAAAAAAYPQAVAHAQAALALLDRLPATETRRRQRVQLLLEAGRVLWHGAGPDESFTLQGALRVLEAARSSLHAGDPAELIADLAVTIAGALYEIGDMASLTRALDELANASRALADSGQPQSAARLFNDQAGVYIRLGDAVRAAHLLGESRKIFEPSSRTDPIAAIEMAETDHLFARLLLHVPARPGREDDALSLGLDHGIAAERVFRRLGAPREVGRVLETMGRLELRKGRLERAAERLTAAVQIQESVGDVIGLAQSTAALADVLAAGGRSEEALNLLADSIVLNFEKGSPLGIAFNRRSFDSLAGSPDLRGRAADVLAAVEDRLTAAERALGRIPIPGTPA